MRELQKQLGIETALSSVHHLETDSQTERVNQDVEQYLRLFVNHNQDDWSDWLAIAEYAYNNRVHSATGRSPFEVWTGRSPELRALLVVSQDNEFAKCD